MYDTDLIISNKHKNNMNYCYRLLYHTQLSILKKITDDNNSKYSFEELVKIIIPELANFEDESLFKEFGISSKIFGFEKELPIRQERQPVTENTEINSEHLEILNSNLSTVEKINAIKNVKKVKINIKPSTTLTPVVNNITESIQTDINNNPPVSTPEINDNINDKPNTIKKIIIKKKSITVTENINSETNPVKEDNVSTQSNIENETKLTEDKPIVVDESVIDKPKKIKIVVKQK